jgi:hypothetical protein
MTDISVTLKDASWDKKEPAKPGFIQELVDNAEKELPDDYLALLFYSNGGEGRLGIEPYWFQLWPAENVIALNQEYRIGKLAPGFFGFGSSGGGELLAFDIQNGESFKIAVIPFVPMSKNGARIIAENFGEFVRAIGRDAK